MASEALSLRMLAATALADPALALSMLLEAYQGDMERSLSGPGSARLSLQAATPNKGVIASGPCAPLNPRWERFRPGSTLHTSTEAAATEAEHSSKAPTDPRTHIFRARHRH